MALNPFKRARPSQYNDPLPKRAPPSHWGLGFNTWMWGGGTQTLSTGQILTPSSVTPSTMINSISPHWTHHYGGFILVLTHSASAPSPLQLRFPCAISKASLLTLTYLQLPLSPSIVLIYPWILYPRDHPFLLLWLLSIHYHSHICPHNMVTTIAITMPTVTTACLLPKKYLWNEELTQVLSSFVFTSDLDRQSHFACHLILIGILQRMWDFPQIRISGLKKVRLHLSAKIRSRNVPLFLFIIIDTTLCHLGRSSRVWGTSYVWCVIPSITEGSILQLKNLQLRESQWPPQSHWAGRRQN